MKSSRIATVFAVFGLFAAVAAYATRKTRKASPIPLISNPASVFGAVLTNSADTDWKDTCLRIVEFLSTVWGGKHGIIVPTDGNTIDEQFWQLLSAHDPDYLFCYRKTFLDVKFSNPAEYDRMLNREVVKFAADNLRDQGAIRLEIEKAFEQALSRSIRYI